MRLEYMSEEERAKFEISEEEEKRVTHLSVGVLASIFGADGRGGSGLFVLAPDGKLGVLTARHVAIRCILTGELTVGAVTRPRTRSVEPTSIRIDNESDSAILTMPESFQRIQGALPMNEWAAEEGPARTGMGVLASGIVGEWKHPDVGTRSIPETRVLNFWTAIIDEQNNKGLIVCDVDETLKRLPKSFGGMSGGPLWSTEGVFLGIAREELRGGKYSDDGKLAFTPSRALFPLARYFSPGGGAPEDFVRQECLFAFWAKPEDGDNSIGMAVNADFHWSQSAPEHPEGRIGRIMALRIINQQGAARLPINIEVVFRLSGTSDEEKMAELREQVDYLLLDTGFHFSEVA